MNPSNRASVGPLSLGNQPRRSFLDAKPINYSNELKQLQEMGFTDSAKCLNALQAHNGNVFDCIDQLSEKSPERSASKKDIYADLIDTSFSSLRIQNNAPVQEESNDWTDLEFSKPIETTPQSLKQPRTSIPLEAHHEPERISTSQQPSVRSEPASDPWKSPAIGTSNLTTVLGSKPLFEDEEDDPFKDLTHNPFK